MNETLIGVIVMAMLGVGLLAPILLGRWLTRWRPAWSTWLVCALGALPTAAPFLGFAIWLAATADITTCDDPPCGNLAPLWFDAMLVIGLLAFLAGFGLAWLGRKTERSRIA